MHVPQAIFQNNLALHKMP